MPPNPPSRLTCRICGGQTLLSDLTPINTQPLLVPPTQPAPAPQPGVRNASTLSQSQGAWTGPPSFAAHSVAAQPPSSSARAPLAVVSAPSPWPQQPLPPRPQVQTPYNNYGHIAPSGNPYGEPYVPNVANSPQPSPFAASPPPQRPASAAAPQATAAYFQPAYLAAAGTKWTCPTCQALNDVSGKMCRACHYSPPFFLPEQKSSSNPFAAPTDSYPYARPFAAPSPSQNPGVSMSGAVPSIAANAAPQNPPPSSFNPFLPSPTQPNPFQPSPQPGTQNAPPRLPSSQLAPPSDQTYQKIVLANNSSNSSPPSDGLSPRSPHPADEALFGSTEMASFVCPHDKCGSHFDSLDLYTEHMALHSQNVASTSSEEMRKLAWYKEGYTGQYRRAILLAYQNRQISDRRLSRMLDELDHCLERPDEETRTRGMVSLIKDFYNLVASKYNCIVSKGVDHYFTGFGDAGWGCGYRNIQMISSYLWEFAPMKKALFQNRGYIPGVVAIQEMIEGCWTKGFDPSGAKVFGSKLKDTKGMIGATDAAALFRSFGIKMDVVDFISRPLDRAVIQAQREEARHDSKPIVLNEPNMELLDWVWNYFQQAGKKKKGLFSKKFLPPLFLQHPGHSRTIVGAERNTKTGEIALIIFDPAHYGDVLKRELKNGLDGLGHFRKLLRDFTHSSYQVGVIVSDDLMDSSEIDKSKEMDFAAEKFGKS